LKDWLGSLRRHKALKILSLLLAVALWFAVSGEERTETTLSVALELANLRPHMTIVSEVPPALQVRVIGPRSTIGKLSQARLTHTIDLAHFQPGRHTVNLGPNSFAFPRGVVVTRIQPNPLDLTLAASITRTLPIRPILEGSPPEGYEVIGAETRPPQVTVKGPSGELNSLKFIPTLPIEVSNLTERTVVGTDLDFKALHLTLKEQISILADLNIGPKTLTRTFSGVPVAAGPLPARLSPAQISLTLQGPYPQVKDLKPEEVKATVDTGNLSPGRHRLNVSVDLPAGASLMKMNPAAVTATVARPR
jgi:YbbR domain-containing protein